jgi:hypothetical protein
MDARSTAASSSSNEMGCLSRFLTSYIGGSCRRLPISSGWTQIAANSSGPQRAVGDAPTAALEAVGKLIE